MNFYSTRRGLAPESIFLGLVHITERGDNPGLKRYVSMEETWCLHVAEHDTDLFVALAHGVLERCAVDARTPKRRHLLTFIPIARSIFIVLAIVSSVHSSKDRFKKYGSTDYQRTPGKVKRNVQNNAQSVHISVHNLESS